MQNIHPTYDQFCQMAEPGCVIPVYREILADMETPVSAYRKLMAPGAGFLLESVEGGERIGRYSFLGTGVSDVMRVDIGEGVNPMPAIRERLTARKYIANPELPRFCGGCVGYLGYDTVRGFESLPDTPQDDLNMPDGLLMFPETVLVFDQVKRTIKIVTEARVQDDPGAAYAAAVDRLGLTLARLRYPQSAPNPQPSTVSSEVCSNLTKQQFMRSVEQAKEYIAAGEIIQVVLSQRFSMELSAHPFDLYRSLRCLNPSPYSFYLDYGDYQLVGSSPEILVTCEGGEVRNRPIAGTRRRGTTDAEDLLLERELLADEKERAEHIMLVDLGRNDIGRVAEYGTVRVNELMVVERYSHVMHIVSDVRGKLRSDLDMLDTFEACFPAGTVSGAPKVRAMQIIDELETTRRGPYAGAVGYFSYAGDSDTCITIRTILVKDGRAYVQAGAGIVADSDPETEFVETQTKAKAMLRSVELAQQGLE
ncbi:MAG: anthranilate synthase component I [Armatimonadota bacterium]